MERIWTNICKTVKSKNSFGSKNENIDEINASYVLQDAELEARREQRRSGRAGAPKKLEKKSVCALTFGLDRKIKS